MTERAEILKVKNLSLWVLAEDRDIPIIENASFSVREGERWGIAGESGAGKSMLLHAITGLLPTGSTKTAGEVLYRLADGSWQDLMSVPRKEKREFVSTRVAFIFQDSIHALNPNERIIKQWSDTIRLHHPKIDETVCRQHVLDQMDEFGIRGGMDTLRNFPHQLSGGMRQRIAIAMALESQSRIGDHANANRGGIIIADEPTTSLDSITQRSVVDYILEICKAEGKTLLYVSHNLGILQYVCDHIMVLREGVIIEQGSAEDVFYHPQEAYTKTLVKETKEIMGRMDGGAL